MTQLTKEKVFFSNLDGLRFYCFLGVFLVHSFATEYRFILDSSVYKFVKNFLFANGHLGVNFFFVLSGFLITYLLIEEKNKFGSISIKNFYVRRILRIWPLFFFCIFFGFYIFPNLKSLFGEIPNETATIKYYLVFLNNFELISKGIPDSSILGVLWSVAIEEQFYLLWPILLTVVPIRYYWILFSILIIGSFLFRYFNAQNPMILVYHTFSCISDMTVGASFALVALNKKKLYQFIVFMSRWKIMVLYLATLLIFLFRTTFFSFGAFLLALDRLVISVLFALIIAEQTYSVNSFYKMERYKKISKLGTYTYGLYCLHMIGILIVAKGLSKLGFNKTVFNVLFIEGLLSFLISILLAFLSYHLFEKHFLRLKDRFARIVKA